MTTTWLAYFPSPPRGVWHLGPLPIRAYALFIITGIIVALIIGDRRFVARGGERGVVYDIALWMVPFGLIGGRLYHLATDWQTYFGRGGAGFAAALRIWDGGLGIWGAVTLGAVGAWIGCRRRGIPLPSFMDAVAPGVVLAQAIGRLGNYFNQELYGRETTLPWGLEIFYRRDPAGFIDVHSLDGVSTGQLAAVVQPTFLYELIWNVMVFAVLIYLDRRFTIGHGRLFGLYVALYCVGRFGVELLRDDTATHIAGTRINVFTSTFVFIGAVVYVMLAPKGREDPATVRGNAAVADGTAEPEPAAQLAAVAAASSAASSAITAVAPIADDGETVESTETAKALEVAEPEAATAQVAEVEAEEHEAEAEEVEAEDEPTAQEAEAEEADAEQAEAPTEAEGAEPEVHEVTAEEPEPQPDPGLLEAGEEQAAEPDAVEVEGIESQPADSEVCDTEPKAEGEEAGGPNAQAQVSEPEVDQLVVVEAEEGQASSEPGSPGDPAPASPGSVTSDNPGSTRQGWRARLRSRRQRR